MALHVDVAGFFEGNGGLREGGCGSIGGGEGIVRLGNILVLALGLDILGLDILGLDIFGFDIDEWRGKWTASIWVEKKLLDGFLYEGREKVSLDGGDAFGGLGGDDIDS